MCKKVPFERNYFKSLESTYIRWSKRPYNWGLDHALGLPCVIWQQDLFSFFSLFFTLFFSLSAGLVQLFHRWSSTQILLYQWATFCGGFLPNVQFCFLVAAGFEPTSLSLRCGRFTTTLSWPLRDASLRRSLY